MCMSAPKAPPAPIMQAPRQVVSQAVEAVDRPIELVTADKDIKKKKKLASKRGTSALQTGMNTATGSTNSGVYTST